MKVIRWEEAQVKENPYGVDARLLYETEHAQVVHLFLKPGEKLKRHVTPVDVFFYVLEGEGVVEIGDEKRKAKKDDLIDSPANIPHCWYNESNAPLRILVVKVPRPTKPTNIL